MTATGGRFEGTVSVPTGGYDVAGDAGGGAFTATIPAGDYFMGEFVTELATQLNAGPGGTWTLTKNWGESQAGTVTIACSATFSLTFTDTEVGNIIGHSNIVSSAVAVTGSHVQGIWIPACPKWTPYGDNIHDRHSDLRQSIAPEGGGVKTLSGTKYDALAGMRWDMVSQARAIGAGDTVPNGSWMRFWRDVCRGEQSYFLVGKSVMFYWDADDQNSFNEYNLVVNPSTEIQPVVSGWTGRYRIELPMLVYVGEVA